MGAPLAHGFQVHGFSGSELIGLRSQRLALLHALDTAATECGVQADAARQQLATSLYQCLLDTKPVALGIEHFQIGRRAAAVAQIREPRALGLGRQRSCWKANCRASQ